MAIADVSGWMAEFGGPDRVWVAKRLSFNDTSVKGHQAGPYIPKEHLFRVVPEINRIDVYNPKQAIQFFLDSHGQRSIISATYYNNSRSKENGTRDEARLTGFGGRESPLLDGNNAGALLVLAFLKASHGAAPDCRAWLARNPQEEDLLEERLGSVEPGRITVWSSSPEVSSDLFEVREEADCWIPAASMPPEWRSRFPSALAIVQKCILLRPCRGLNSDERLIKRRDCEYEIFRSIEQEFEMSTISAGFRSIDEFVSRAQTILQRRKSRSGLSLELQTRQIFIEESLAEGVDFSHQPESDAGKRPDFLFPSQAAYKTQSYPSSSLRMLAVKTTCKDRWRQIINEADRIPVKHLLTLQAGVSESQFKEMEESGVALVVPQKLVAAYPESVRSKLLTLERFIGSVRNLASA